MAEPLILKVQADTKGVPEGLNRVTRSAEGLDISSRKASMAIKGFVQDLSQARSSADIASAALGAFSRVLGTSIAGTAIAIAGKTVIDTFTKIGETVEQTRERISTASEEIKKSGLDISFTQAAGEAKRLSDEADGARKNIEKLDKSFLQGLVATITGAREELGKLAKEAEDLAQQRLFEGAKAERMRAEERAGLQGGQLEIKDVEERLARELRGVDVTTPAGIRAASELRKRAEIDIANIRQKAADKFDIEKAKEELKFIDAEIAGRRAAEKIGADFDSKRAQEEARRQEELLRERARLQEEIDKKTRDAERDAINLRLQSLDLEDRLVEQRKQIIQAEGRVAAEVSRQGGTGRGPGQKPTSFEVGAVRKAEKAAQDEAFRLRQQERMRIRGELEGEGATYDPKTGRQLTGRRVSGFDIDREISRKLDEAYKAQQQEVYDDARNARAGAQATEDTLRQVQRLLKINLDKITSYAHVT